MTANAKTTLTYGVLGEYRQKVLDTLLNRVDPHLHAETYTGDHGMGARYAEPEFTGKYLDLCAAIYQATGNPIALENAEFVFQSILKNRRSDGYLGCMPKGMEFDGFGVWNQTFTVLGLTSLYSVQKDERMLQVAQECVDFTMHHFIEDGYDLFDAWNEGSQHASILLSLCRLYALQPNQRNERYIRFIVEKMKHSDMNFFSFNSILDLKSKKGIENFVILLGILEYGKLFHDPDALEGAKKYWQELADTQIRNTGNGTVHERWAPNGNACGRFAIETQPNENCVAIGWVEFSLALFYATREPKYLDAMERTVYNHILGSISEDGSGFAYYQPTFGRRAKASERDMYACCKYRGFTFFTYLGRMFCYEDERLLMPMLYTPGRYVSEDTSLTLQTEYPYQGTVSLYLRTKRAKTLRLRVPEKCEAVSLKVNGEPAELLQRNGCLEISLSADMRYSVELILENRIVVTEGEIEGEKQVSFEYGALLLAANDVGDSTCLTEEPILRKIEPTGGHRVLFEIENASPKIVLSEYSSADHYDIWLRSRGKLK